MRTRDDLVEIRNAVRAVIIRDDAVLFQHKISDANMARYTLPGGAPELGESLEEGLRRECMEEIGAAVEIIELMHVADYLKPRDTSPVTYRPQVEFFFRCRVSSDYRAQNGPRPDRHQVDVVWLPTANLSNYSLTPPRLTGILPGDGSLPVYLGSIN